MDKASPMLDHCSPSCLSSQFEMIVAPRPKAVLESKPRVSFPALSEGNTQGLVVLANDIGYRCNTRHSSRVADLYKVTVLNCFMSICDTSQKYTAHLSKR